MHIWSASRHALSLDSSRTRLIIEHYKAPSKHQLWRLEDNGQLRNNEAGLDWELGKDIWKRENNYLVHEKSGKVLDVEGGSTKSGARVIVFQKHGGSNQRWYFDHANVDKTYKYSLTSGGVLGDGQELKSINGEYTLRMQEDGNLVVYLNSNPVLLIWESRTDNVGSHPHRLELQQDNNLCIYGRGKCTWSSQTSGLGKPGAWVTLQVKNTLIESKMQI